jgi:uncharacterized membrane protein HdeD (DUF308 family)
MKDFEDWLLYLGLALIVGGVACIYWPAAVILAGVFVVGVAVMRAYLRANGHAE